MKALETILHEINTAHRPCTIEHADALVTALCAERACLNMVLSALKNTTATVAALYQWLEQVEAVGGATNLSGIAKCHAMLTSMRKNAHRTEKLVMAPARAAIIACDAEAE